MERTLRPLAYLVLVLVALRIFGEHLTIDDRWAHDARAYWTAWRGEMYDAPWHGHESFVYSPAFAHAIWPLTLLPWPAFWVLWTGLELALLVALCGPVLAAVLAALVLPVMAPIAEGNIDLLIGAAVALSLRWPALWAIPLLTKVTPGIGIVWFAVRREWRNLLLALGGTALLALASVLFAPQLWRDWAAVLTDAPNQTTNFPRVIIIDGPLWLRLMLAGGLVAWGAWTDRPWTLAVAAFVAVPLPSSNRLAMLLGALPLLGWGPLARQLHQPELGGGVRHVGGVQRSAGVLPHL